MSVRRVAAVVLALVLGGCRAGGEREVRDDTPSPPPVVAGIDSSGEEGARDVLRRYYAALQRRDYPAAYDLWARGGTASGQTAEDFAAGFVTTATTEVAITGPSTIEGAAGSSFATVPVRVTATTAAGDTQRFEGSYVLRRVNDVPGATPEQLRWHLESARLAPTR